MSVSYRRLWRVLEKKKLSKTDFRNFADISTATLAKLSADDVVALPVLEKICQALNCQIEDVLEIIPTVPAASCGARWKRVKDEKNYVVRLLYLAQRVPADQGTDAAPDRIQFLYGYSIACGDETEQGHSWALEKINGNGRFEVWSISLTISGEALLILLGSMEQKKSIQSFLDQSGSRLKTPSKKRDFWIVPAISEVVFYPDEMYYRPEILLIPARESYRLRESFQPIHSPDEEPLFCEAFVSAGMRSLYCDKDGELDPDRMDVIRDAFRKEGILLNGNKDLVRISAFEVLSHMKEDAMQRELYSVEPIINEQRPLQKCIAGYIITVYHRHLKGDYRLEVSVYNAGNVTACQVFDLTIDGRDVVRQIDLEESSGSLEVRLFEMGTGERIKLIGFKSLTLMREMSLVLDVTSRRSGLIDRYTKREKRADHRIERYSSEKIHIGDSGNDPWRKLYERVYEDFDQLYGSEQAETKVFSLNGPSHEDFLRWLKEKTNAGRIRQVYLFDPFIDADSIYRIIRLIGNTGIRYTIVTDAHANSHTRERIKTIETACKRLDILLPSGTRILAFDQSKEERVLHDRFLFLVGNRYLPEVYCMSNSLDNMGMKTPSVVCRLARMAAKEIVDYYIGQLQEMEAAGQVRVLWESAQNEQTAVPCISGMDVLEDLSAVILPFNHILGQNGKCLIAVNRDSVILWPDDSPEQVQAEIVKLLCAAAASYWEEFACLFNNARKGRQMLSEGLRAVYDDRLEKKLSSVMDNFLGDMKIGATLPENLGVDVSPVLDVREILQLASWMMDNPWEGNHSRRMRAGVRLAVETLIRCGFSVFQDIFVDIYNIHSKASVETMYAFLEVLAVEINLSPAAEQEELAGECLCSENPHLIAMGIQWSIRQYKANPKMLEHAAQILEGTDHCQELFREIIIKHQILLLRKQDQSVQTDDKHGNDIKQLKELWAQWLPPGLDRAQLSKWFDGLNSRNVSDTCDMVSLVLEQGKTTVEEAQEYLIACMFRKLDDQLKLENGHFGGREVQDGEIVLNALISLGGQSGIRDFLKKLTSSEKKLVKSLHDVFLRTKNYSKWKCYIDMLIWCRLMRQLCNMKVKGYEELLLEDTNYQTRSREIDGLFRKYGSILSEYSELYHIWQRLSSESI